ncbi:MAG: response regulator [Elusimicrobiota bacterium]
MKTIVITEDEEVLREIFRDELTEAGYNVVLSQNGEECLGILETGNVDLLILDVKLPDMSGLELLGKMKEKYFAVPVIMCTAYDSFQTDYKSWSASAQVKDYIVKPIDLEQLRDKIKKIVG